MSLDDLRKFEESRKTVPRYLFRALSPKHRSLTPPSSIRPLKKPTALGASTVDSLIDDLRWWPMSEPSEFTSWTSSIMFALAAAIKKFKGLDKLDCVRGKRVWLVVLDTEKVPKDVPIYPATTLIDTFHLTHKGVYRDNFLHEYLAHGTIANDSKSGNSFSLCEMKQFEKKGFYATFEPYDDTYLDDTEVKMRQQEQHLYEQFKTRTSGPSRSELRTITRLAKLFDTQFRLPVALALVSIFPFRRLTMFADNLNEYCLTRLGVPGVSVTPSDFSCAGFSEVERFQLLLRAVDDARSSPDQREAE